MTTTTLSAGPVLGTLARQEIRNYAMSKLFWLGALGTCALAVQSLLVERPEAGATAGDGLLPAALIGLLGISIMAGLVRRSDQAAAAAGAVGVPQRTRTLALAIAVVVPASVGLIWFVCAVIGYNLYPPSPRTVPFPGVDDGFVYANMFTEGVMACIGGPLLGLVIGRWLPNRAAAPLISVLIVPISMVMQPLGFDAAKRWHMVWIWTHMVAPYGVDGDRSRFAGSPGSPYFYALYLAALCVLGVLVAMYRDPEGDRTKLRNLALGALAVTVVLAVLAIVVGPNDWVVNPIPSVELAEKH